MSTSSLVGSRFFHVVLSFFFSFSYLFLPPLSPVDPSVCIGRWLCPYLTSKVVWVTLPRLPAIADVVAVPKTADIGVGGHFSTVSRVYSDFIS